MDSKDCDIRF